MRPGLRYALWGLVLLRLLYPGTVLSSPVSVRGVAEKAEVVQDFEAIRGFYGIEYRDDGSVEGYRRDDFFPDDPTTVAEQITPERFARMETAVRVRDVLEPLWRTGMTVTAVIFLASNLRFYQRLRKRRKPLDADCPLRVYSVENLSSSCLFGGAVYVAAETAADETRLRHVLVHEMSHYRNGDHVWALLRCAALALHVLGRDADGQYYEVRGSHGTDENADIAEMIQEVTYRLMDIEVALWRSGYPAPAGSGSEIPFFHEAYDGSPEIEILEGWEPIYWPGAYWSRQTWEGFSALCYHPGEEPVETALPAYRVNTIDTTREDLYTYRGIHIGSTREEVLKAYPDLYDTHYRHDNDPEFPGTDYLWYCDNPEGWGAAILFFFDGDTVNKIRLNDMFN